MSIARYLSDVSVIVLKQMRDHEPSVNGCTCHETVKGTGGLKSKAGCICSCPEMGRDSLDRG